MSSVTTTGTVLRDGAFGHATGLICRECGATQELGPHYACMVVPVLAVAGWLLFGPRQRVDRADIAPALLLPAVWAAYTVARGELVDWYPYPFIDVNEHGYAVVLLNCLGVAALMTAFFAGAQWLDRRLSRARPAA